MRCSLQVSIPPTSDAFSFQVELVWLDANGLLVSSRLEKRYTAATGEWTLAGGDFTAPAGASRAMIRMNVSGLTGTVYVDDVVFWP
jgi:hypothetical protein